MGTHPIFESDFDCLTDFGLIKMQLFLEKNLVQVETTNEVLSLVGDDVYAVYQGRPLREGFTCEEFGLTEEAEIELVPRLMGGKVHGSLARAGKVKGQTPKVTNRRKRRPKLDVLSDACNTTADSSTSFPLSARRRDPTPTANAPKICDLARK